MSWFWRCNRLTLIAPTVITSQMSVSRGWRTNRRVVYEETRSIQRMQTSPRLWLWKLNQKYVYLSFTHVDECRLTKAFLQTWLNLNHIIKVVPNVFFFLFKKYPSIIFGKVKSCFKNKLVKKLFDYYFILCNKVSISIIPPLHLHSSFIYFQNLLRCLEGDIFGHFRV